MNPKKQFILFFSVVFLGSLLLVTITGGRTLTILLVFLGFAFFFAGLGYLIGWIAYELKLKPFKIRNKIFLAGNSVGFSAFIALMIFFFINSQNTSYKRKNREDNHTVMRYFVNDDEPYIRIAFDRLEAKFANPDAFKLNSWAVRYIDTVLNGSKDSLFNVYFTYYLVNDSTRYLSKISVWQGMPNIHVFNDKASENSEYAEIQSENETKQHEFIKSFKKDLEKLPDSSREKIREAIKAISN
jgi:hypothetical protein